MFPAETRKAGNRNKERRTTPMKKLIALILSMCMLAGLLPAVAEKPADTTAETEKVDMNRLIDHLLSDIHNAVVRVDMADLKANSVTTPENFKGNVFTVFKIVLTDLANAMAENGKTDEDLNKVIERLSSPEALKDIDEKDLEVLSSLVIMSIIAAADERAEKAETEEALKEIAIANSLLKAIFDACQENEILTAAVKATDSRLFDMLLETNRYMKEYVEKNGALYAVNIEANAEPYAAFEAEIKKLEDYLKAINGPKQNALDMLALLHAAMDDVHLTIEAAVHTAKKLESVNLINEMLNDLGEAISKINLDEIRAKAGAGFTTKGSVYSVLEKIINNMLADTAVVNKDSDETLTKSLETLGKLDSNDVAGEDAGALFTLLFMSFAAAGDEVAAVELSDPAEDFRRASSIMKAAYDTVLENDTITAAIEATGSRMLEMLKNINDRLQKYLEKNGTLIQVEDVDEAPFIAFEAELAKVREYIEKDGIHSRALGMLDLLHEYVDDIHQAIDSDTHEDVKK